ncbi:MAG TPA: hypothetical protein VN581_03575 [Patescibacteria group bacterium]|nr:hypothetical protein [Patescibacteria group bacterium]
MRRRLLIVAAVVAGSAHAEICQSPPMELGAATPPNNATVFQCSPELSGTMNALAQAGYDIVSLRPVVVSTNPYRTADQLVIQKTDAVFDSGFE